MNKICLQIVQKALKWLLLHVNFLKFSGEQAPGPPGIVFVTQVWKSDEIWCPLPERISEYAPDMKHFKKAYLLPCLGLNVLTPLHIVNIQPNSKLLSPYQNFLNPLLEMNTRLGMIKS